jgi:hypothetical protein
LVDALGADAEVPADLTQSHLELIQRDDEIVTSPVVLGSGPVVVDTEVAAIDESPRGRGGPGYEPSARPASDLDQVS